MPGLRCVHRTRRADSRIALVRDRQVSDAKRHAVETPLLGEPLQDRVCGPSTSAAGRSVCAPTQAVAKRTLARFGTSSCRELNSFRDEL